MRLTFKQIGPDKVQITADDPACDVGYVEDLNADDPKVVLRDLRCSQVQEVLVAIARGEHRKAK